MGPSEYFFSRIACSSVARAGIVTCLIGVSLFCLSACVTTTRMDTYVPDHCHGSAEPFSTYTVSMKNVPGFIEEVVDTAIRGALDRLGLVADEEGADILVHSELEIIDRNPPRQQTDPFGETVAPNELNRFVTHLKVGITDARTGRLIWTGAMDRFHAIQGGETFHNDRAILIISQAFDDMFVGLTTPCE